MGFYITDGMKSEKGVAFKGRHVSLFAKLTVRTPFELLLNFVFCARQIHVREL